MLGVGVVGIGVGSVSGILAIDPNMQSMAYCDANNATLCYGTGVAQPNTAMTYGNVSTVAFIAGGAFAVAGAVFIAIPTKKTHASAAIEPTFGGARLVLSGAF